MTGMSDLQREAVSFNEKYTQVSGSYAVEGDAFSPFMYDKDAKEIFNKASLDVNGNPYKINYLMIYKTYKGASYVRG